jgi:membrane protein
VDAVKAWWARQRQRPWIDHLVRAGEAYSDRYGNHYAAAITYFSVLSLFPLIMIAFAVAGFVLAGNHDLLVQLQNDLVKAAPGGLGDTLSKVVNQAVESRTAVGVIGLLAAAYSGLGWMTNLRDALTAQWGLTKPELPLLRTMLYDLLSLLGLGAAMFVSFGLTAVGTGLGSTVLRLVGLQDAGWALVLLGVVTIALSLAANWLVFLWVIGRLPRHRVGMRSAVRGALAAALGFEVLKQVMTIYLKLTANSPAGALFGPIIGLLVFANFVARFLLFITAWTATATENVVPAAPTAGAVIRPVVRVSRVPSAWETAGLLGVGALLGLALRRRR